MDASKTCLVIIPRLRLLHVLCDCDIQYFPHKDKWWNELLALLESGVLFMQENTRNEINSGVYIIPHSMRQDMIALLDVIITDPSYYKAYGAFIADQSLFNLYRGSIRHAFIPQHFVVWGSKTQGGHFITRSTQRTNLVR